MKHVRRKATGEMSLFVLFVVVWCVFDKRAVLTVA